MSLDQIVLLWFYISHSILHLLICIYITKYLYNTIRKYKVVNVKKGERGKERVMDRQWMRKNKFPVSNFVIVSSVSDDSKDSILLVYIPKQDSGM